MAERTSNINRETQETNVNLEFVIDGKGDFEITTGIRMFDHLLAQLARHGAFDLKVSANGADPHHLVEDVALCLGRVFNQAVDIGGRGYAVVETSFVEKNIADLPTDLVRHFLETFASEARLNLHAKLLRGSNDHHRAEAAFKALARALDDATRFDERIKGKLPSTKGVIEG